MRFFEKLKLIERVDQLIKMKATGNAQQLASTVGVSRSTVFEIIAIMKAMGAEIQYSNTKNTYFYISEKVLGIGFVNKSMINGGKNIYSPIFSNCIHLPLF